MTYPLTVEEIRERRFERDKSYVLSDLNRLNWERREIREDYEKVSRTYVAHLERLKKKMDRHNQQMRNLAARASEVAERR